MSVKASATEGLFSGFLVGSIDAWNKKALFVLMFGLVALFVIANLVMTGDGGSEPAAFGGMSHTETIAYLVGFAIGWVSSHLMFKEAFGDE